MSWKVWWWQRFSNFGGTLENENPGRTLSNLPTNICLVQTQIWRPSPKSPCASFTSDEPVYTPANRLFHVSRLLILMVADNLYSPTLHTSIYTVVGYLQNHHNLLETWEKKWRTIITFRSIHSTEIWEMGSECKTDFKISWNKRGDSVLRSETGWWKDDRRFKFKFIECVFFREQMLEVQLPVIAKRGLFSICLTWIQFKNVWIRIFSCCSKSYEISLKLAMNLTQRKIENTFYLRGSYRFVVNLKFFYFYGYIISWKKNT